ncbi:RNA methyltransferase [Flavobacterium sp. F372]|uniref:RNA methyltransferase n=1 Tax=Flavobacterium bernardetii TaxID=2813823 RepID=A0ABR7J2F0_9FLAO|nr:RNA methyltransferase [Flavobacterium bernardetii]MBC5835892.1 RNA methyltransferase [Flavobacterium bernardetii]NHF71162.1 RNA methyltransferase [Flavobacterium bernardetii]
MVSKNQIKLINSLQQKKYRKLHNLFIAEGKKVIQELIDADFRLEHLFVTKENLFDSRHNSELISDGELKKITALTTANDCLAVFKIKEVNSKSSTGLELALDNIKDPGNMGTIIRLCDWFGISKIVCTEETVDIYNPKVVQATMGSLARVEVLYTNLTDYLKTADVAIFGTFMEGKNIYKTELPSQGIIVMGNEANGISAEIESLVTQKISIPRFGNLQQTESLNVATATAVILSEFKRSI